MELANGFAPSTGQTFDLLTADFGITDTGLELAADDVEDWSFDIVNDTLQATFVGAVRGALQAGDAAQNLGGSFDNDADKNVFKATFGASFGSISFGKVAQVGLEEDFLLGDLTVVGSRQGGGALGEVDLVYVPEPSALVLVLLGLWGVVATGLLRRGCCDGVVATGSDPKP